MLKQDNTLRQVEVLYSKAKDLLRKNYTEEEVVEHLTKDGIEPHYALLIIENVQDDKSDSKSFRNSMIMGFFYIISGLLINILSYKIAVNVSSIFFISFGE